MNFLIQIEGARGVGKSTLALDLQAALEDELPCVRLEEEPTPSIYGNMALLRTGRGLNDLETLMLFCLDRHKHMTSLSLPSRSTILCARYSLSTFAYQAVRCGEDMNEIEKRMKLLSSIHENLQKPNMTLYLHADWEMWLETNLPALSMRVLKQRADTHAAKNADRANLRAEDAASREAYQAGKDAYAYALSWIKRENPSLLGELIEIEAFESFDVQKRKLLPRILEAYRIWSKLAR